MINIKNLEKAINREVCILLKFGDYMSVSGVLLRIEQNDIILRCKDNVVLGDARVLESEAHVPISSLAVWYLIEDSIYSK